MSRSRSRAGRATQADDALEDPLAPAVADVSTLRAPPAATDYAPPPLRPGFVDRDRLLRRLLTSFQVPLVLVLDDVHELHAEESLEIVGAIAEDLRAGSQLALGSRTDPPLLLGRLRAHRNLLELRSRDLAMTEAEGAPLLAETGVALQSPE